VIVVLCGVIAMQPSAYAVQRSTTINAPAATVFAHVNDFHKWEAWSPWAKLDPAMKTEYKGSAEGQGSIYHWTSADDNVGEGEMTIVQSHPSEHVGIDLKFIAPMESASKTDFTFKETGACQAGAAPAAAGAAATPACSPQTTVEWKMTGNNNFMAKGFFLFTGGMDKMIGPDFEKGLAALKAAAEK
jgi:hypothetical protein